MLSTGRIVQVHSKKGLPLYKLYTHWLNEAVFKANRWLFVVTKTVLLWFPKDTQLCLISCCEGHCPWKGYINKPVNSRSHIKHWLILYLDDILWISHNWWVGGKRGFERKQKRIRKQKQEAKPEVSRKINFLTKQPWDKIVSGIIGRVGYYIITGLSAPTPPSTRLLYYYS